MSNETQRTVVELLQELGLKEYEAKVFAALTRVSHGTAREISDLADVPRTRVYDAAEQLSDRGLVEVQQAQPQQYRAISIDEAVDVLRRQYDARFERLGDALADLETGRSPGGTPEGVWSLSGSETIAERAIRLVENADEEVVALFGTPPDAAAVESDGGRPAEPEDWSGLFSEDGSLVERLRTATGRGVTVYLGSLAPDERVRERVHAAVPDAERPNLLEEWLSDAEIADAEDIGCLLVADRDELLLSAVADRGGESVETAIRSTEFGNGLLVLIRRLLANGLSE